MQALLEDMKTGQVFACEVPAPEIRPGGVLVRTHFSAISSGTERVKVEAGEKSLLEKALARPDLVRQVLDFARQNGIGAAVQKVRARLETLSPLGYSAAGVVIEVGEGVNEFRRGDRVACGGGGHASHCSVNFVPRNLAVHVPDAVSLEAASITTIGAIAMQGIRQAQAQVGETVAVIGAGLIGVLTIQVARAAGCRVLAIDRDSGRAARATESGAHVGLTVDDPRLETVVRDFSRYGADIAIITAATPSAEPLELASRILRDRGRLVIVGDVGMGVSRSRLYTKELSIAMSRSYGPGRYDPQFEELGHDYPVGHVRWTERRNMEAFLDLVAQGSVNVERLLEHRYPVERGPQAYADIRAKGIYTAIIDYGSQPEQRMPSKDLEREDKSLSALDKLRVGCIGAGEFARSMIFPGLRSNKEIVLESVATLSGVGAESARRSFGFSRTQQPDALLQDPSLDSIFVLSRHDSHAKHVVSALVNGKRVFVEKPLAVTREQLQDVDRAYHSDKRQGGLPFVMVGFNRRFAPATKEIRSFFQDRTEPMVLLIRANAGFMPRDHWVHESGGRVVGELCHFVDWARSIVGVPIREVYANALPDGSRYSRDNIAATISFGDGSVASILYVANGNRAVPKEYYEAYCEGGIARLDDFSTLELSRNGKTKRINCHKDKGHTEELQLTIQAMRRQGPAPIPFRELAEVTEATFAIHESITSGVPQTLSWVGDPVVPVLGEA